MWREKALVFPCEGEQLSAILHTAERPSGKGILLVVGGPNYRAGSHRQFVDFARSMASEGTAVLRFDYRGMGDSAGPYLDFEQVSKDLDAALTLLLQEVPELDDICVFGLCDAASSALMFSAYDSRVNRLLLLNPWVRSEQTEAKAAIKHYYGKRLLSADFWRKLFSGEVRVMASIRDVLRKLWLSRKSAVSAKSSSAASSTDFRQQMLAGAKQFKGSVLLVLSGNDFTANEFEQVVTESGDWTECVDRWTTVRVPDANHTFARSDWKRKVVEHASEWMNAS